jgi:1,4-alpha-glucan branching enzyme
MSLKKQYLTSKPVCKVTFKLSKDEANSAKAAYVVGEFNNWETTATPMNKTTAGSFSVTVDLDCEKEIQYKYLLNSDTWINDPAADKYVYVPEVGSDNSVVVIDVPAAPKKAAPKKKAAAPKKATASKKAATSKKTGGKKTAAKSGKAA